MQTVAAKTLQNPCGFAKPRCPSVFKLLTFHKKEASEHCPCLTNLSLSECCVCVNRVLFEYNLLFMIISSALLFWSSVGPSFASTFIIHLDLRTNFTRPEHAIWASLHGTLAERLEVGVHKPRCDQTVTKLTLKRREMCRYYTLLHILNSDIFLCSL